MSQIPMPWERHPKAESLLLRVLEKCCEVNPFIASFQEDLRRHTSTRLFDWLDHVIVGHSVALEQELEESGFVCESASKTYQVFHHPGAQLPHVIVRDQGCDVIAAAVKVESIADFLMVRGLSKEIEGSCLSGYRRCCVSSFGGVSLWVVERRGTWTFEPTYTVRTHVDSYHEALERWQTRPRGLEDEGKAMANAISTAQDLVGILGKDMAAWVVLEVERHYWQSRNTAAQIQKSRQDRLGMGWANHDHHTFRSSRKHFPSLVRLFEVLGFHCRERFYAGKEAGWGAQVMENSNCGLVLFLDVDLSPHEIEIDFAHHQIPPIDELGTIGLWCALHGDSILKAGMHHLEAQFDFDQLSADLSHRGVRMMEPFSNFSYLRQAFTSGEVWHVDPRRIDYLVKEGKITQEQADKFLSYGAVGSHLENLQRSEGYKGFNQKNVSFIIKKTDPRSLL